jgi:hypothetical protein
MEKSDLIKEIKKCFEYEIKEAVKELKLLTNIDDTELEHIRKDEILVDLLNNLGLSEVTKEYELGEKWYS